MRTCGRPKRGRRGGGKGAERQGARTAFCKTGATLTGKRDGLFVVFMGVRMGENRGLVNPKSLAGAGAGEDRLEALDQLDQLGPFEVLKERGAPAAGPLLPGLLRSDLKKPDSPDGGSRL